MTDDRPKVAQPPGTDEPAKLVTLREARQAFERAYILEMLARHGWQVTPTARALGLQRPNLYRKARQLRLSLKRPATDE